VPRPTPTRRRDGAESRAYIVFIAPHLCGVDEAHGRRAHVGEAEPAGYLALFFSASMSRCYTVW